MKKFFIAAAIVVSLIVTSCSTPKNVAYFPDLDGGAILQAEHLSDIKVKPGDKLSIVVSTQDPALNNLFNLVTSQVRLGSTTTSSGTGQISYYTVDSKGDIVFPVLGAIHVSGLNREQVAQKIFDDLTRENLVKDPVVTVEYTNTGVNILGEVYKPGRYEFNRDHMTVLDAIAMAGDLKINGMRENILVMRKQDDGTQKAYRINLLNAEELANSPVYYLQQDDLIYVEPNDKVKRETTPNGNSPFTPSFWISIGSTALTVATLIITLSK